MGEYLSRRTPKDTILQLAQRLLMFTLGSPEGFLLRLCFLEYVDKLIRNDESFKDVLYF